MKLIKLSLLVLPLMVMADNPIVPMDADSADQKSSSNNSAQVQERSVEVAEYETCLLYTSPSPRDRTRSRMPSSA